MNIKKSGADGKLPFQNFSNARVNIISNLDLSSKQHSPDKPGGVCCHAVYGGRGKFVYQ